MRNRSEFVSSDSSAWVDALGRVRHEMYYLPEYLALEADRVGGRPTAFVYREADLIAFLPMIVRPVPDSSWMDAVSPYGYCGPISNAPLNADCFWQRFCRALMRDLRNDNVLTCFVRLNPLFPVPIAALESVSPVVPHGLTVAIDLSKSTEELWASTRLNHRRQIGRARREGLEVVFDDLAGLAIFCEIYRETMNRVGATDVYFFDDSYFNRLLDDLGSRAHLVLVKRSGEVLAGLLIFECDGIVQYHLGGTLAEALSLQPSKLAMAEIAVWAKERGNQVFHLGGGVGGQEDPLFHFKAGFSPWHVPFSTWRIVTDLAAYGELVVERTVTEDPARLGNFFPGYRQPPAALLGGGSARDG